MKTINIGVTPDELSYLINGLSLVEDREETRDAIMNAGLSKQAGSSHHSDDLAVNAQIVKERDELLSNLRRKLNDALRELAAK